MPSFLAVELVVAKHYPLAITPVLDFHSLSFHFVCQNGKSYQADVVDLFPGTFEMVEMQVGNPGTWLLHCHVADHIHAGMEALFTILPHQGKKKACVVRRKVMGLICFGDCARQNHSVAPRHI